MPFKPGVSSHTELEDVQEGQHHKWPLVAADVGAATPEDVAGAQQAAQDYADQAVAGITPEGIGAATPGDVAAAEQRARDYAESIIPDVPPASSGTESGTVPVRDDRGAIQGFAPGGAGFFVPFVRRGVYSGERVTALAFQGPYLYYGTVQGLDVVDVHDPSAPAAIGSVSFNALGQIVPRGRYLYVSARNASYVIDVANPAEPTVVGTHTDEIGYQQGIALWRNRYFSNGSIVGVDDPANPVSLGEFPDLAGVGRPMWYAARENLVFGVAGNVQAWDVTDPANPALLDVWEDENIAPDPQSPVLNGDLLIVAGTGAYASPNVWQQRLLVFDVSNPTNLTLLGYASQPLGWAGMNRVAVQGAYVYAYSHANDVQTGDGRDALLVWDIENPTAPSLVRTFRLPDAPNGSSARALAVQGEMLAIGYYNGSKYQAALYG